MLENECDSGQYNEKTLHKWNTIKTTGRVWIVSLYGINIDVVWFNNGCTNEEVRKDLIQQYGYNQQIKISLPN